MTRDVIAKMDADELASHQRLTARRSAVELNPRAFTAEETIEAVLDLYRAETEVLRRYDVPDDEYVEIDVTNGVIHIRDEEWVDRRKLTPAERLRIPAENPLAALRKWREVQRLFNEMQRVKRGQKP